MHTAEPQWESLRYSLNEHVATLTLDRPQSRNAIDAVMRRELAEAVSMIRQDRGIKVLILAGAGGAFCSGGDIRSMTGDNSAEQARDRMVSLQGVIRDLLTLDRPIITVVDGAAYGGGMGLALTGDLILASPRARFCLSFLRIGAVPDCGVFYTLPRIVGASVAKQLAFSTREFGAEEAQALGIVSEIHSEQEIHQRAEAMARNLAKLPLASLAITKKAFNASLDSNLDVMLEMEAMGQGIARSTAFHLEAADRFKQKQPPLYQGLD
ncbi:enoyl-CoA hydratase/isomerase family protein [Alcaligenaceae bacterium]|nr:enoyl-CoA hydratase/isomerase family protein [Alcaligenaceae bacterium]